MNLQSLLKMLSDKKGSDLYLAVGAKPIIRVHGILLEIGDVVLTAESCKELIYTVLDKSKTDEFEANKELNCAVCFGDDGRFRLNLFYQRNVVGAVLRRIEHVIPSVDDVGLPPIIENISMARRGLVLVVGAAGSGKSTTLAAMIGNRNLKDKGHIVTIEDPIEFIHEHKNSIISQREVGLDTDSFESALVNALRQAPDVILIGEIRTKETMEHAIHFAETGHLCLATLHATNATQALDRIASFFPLDNKTQIFMELSVNLSAIIAQRLVLAKDKELGRAPAFEILINTPVVADLLRQGNIEDMKSIIERSGTEGMVSMDKSVFSLYEKGIISKDAALSAADSENNVRLKIKMHDEGNKENDSASSLDGVSII